MNRHVKPGARRIFTGQRRLLLFVVLLDAAALGILGGIMSALCGDSFPASAPELSGAGKTIALTFDDGPHGVYTAALLDGLKERNVRASFFLMGQNIAGNEDLVRRMQQEGHLIGNHGYSHIQLTEAGMEAALKGVERTQRLISGITGRRPEYLRPPYGAWNEELENCLDLVPVFWSVDSLDWRLRDRDAIVRRVEETAEDGDVILMHDIFDASVEAALLLIDELQARGWQFAAVDELLID
ncbi:MAG: polysaccharide deacetylase family protein [Eubacteriales bacterium]|nr:polysaccharide deacetylase family protein [Eubacteriales bacterium]